MILVVDSDVPWIPASNWPRPDAAIYAIDIDPMKLDMSNWHIPARCFAAADSKVALGQVGAFVRENILVYLPVEVRRAEIAAANQARRDQLGALEQPADGVITPRYLTECVRDLLDGTDAIVLTEAITNYQVVAEHLRARRPGSLLGPAAVPWAGPAAPPSGPKLASPERTVVSLVGDGSFLFGVPSSAQWVARRYGTPALTLSQVLKTA